MFMWCITSEITGEMTKKNQKKRNSAQIPAAFSRKMIHQWPVIQNA